MYAFYAETQQMLESTRRDIDRVPAIRKAAAAMGAYFEEARSVLLRGRRERGRARERVSAAIGHALAFPTWRSLVREQGLGDEEAADLMASPGRGIGDGAGRSCPARFSRVWTRT